MAEQPEEITEDLLNTYKEQANEIKLGDVVEQLKKLTAAYLEKANTKVRPITEELVGILIKNDALNSQRISDFYKKLDQIGTGNKTNLQHIKEDKRLFNGISLTGLFKPFKPGEEYVGEIEKLREPGLTVFDNNNQIVMCSIL